MFCKKPGLTSLIAQSRILLQCRRPQFDSWVGKIPWRKDSYPLQYSGLENSKECIVHGIAKSWTQLGDFDFQDPPCLFKAGDEQFQSLGALGLSVIHVEETKSLGKAGFLCTDRLELRIISHR